LALYCHCLLRTPTCKCSIESALHTGTSGTEYFGDLWVFRGSEAALRWELLAAVGVGPSPRFGHQMVVLYDEKGVEGTRFLRACDASQSRLTLCPCTLAAANHYQNGGQQLMVLGGCTFRPQADMAGRNLVPGNYMLVSVCSAVVSPARLG
jgi:hypothetical protein